MKYVTRDAVQISVNNEFWKQIFKDDKCNYLQCQFLIG
jgi:hypothetical protein